MISNYATNIALINKDLKKITKIIWGNIYNVEEFETVDTKPIVVENLAVQQGDDYNELENKFYHNGVEVKPYGEELATARECISIIDGSIAT